MADSPVFKQLDQVQILTIDNVHWLSAPPGRATSPKGIWAVVGMIGDELVISKDQTVLRIPFCDVKKVADYDTDEVLTSIREYWNEQSQGKREAKK